MNLLDLFAFKVIILAPIPVQIKDYSQFFTWDICLIKRSLLLGISPFTEYELKSVNNYVYVYLILSVIKMFVF